MKISMMRSLGVGALLLAQGVLFHGCADSRQRTMTFALAGSGDFFELNIYEGAVNTEFDGAQLFESGCIQRSATGANTFTITNVPASDDATIVFRYYSAATCEPSSRVGLGYRGGVVIEDDDEQGYHHVSIIPESGVAAIPSMVNLSQSAMESVSYCESDTQCPTTYSLGDSSFESAGGCYRTKATNALTSQYWCAPVCEDDGDCAVMHPDGVCDTTSRWCMLPSTFPIGTSQPRAFGTVMSTDTGDLMLLGGFSDTEETSEGGQRLTLGERGAERFEVSTGLFAPSGVDDEYLNVGLAGYAAVAQGHIVAVGGSPSVVVTVGFDSSIGLTEVTPSGDVVMVDPAAGTVEVFEDAMEASAATAVVSVSDFTGTDDAGFLVIGGLRSDGDVEVVPSSRVTYCEREEQELTCTTVGSMSVSRVLPAAQCLGDQCQLILVAGGNTSGAPFEVLDLSALTSNQQVAMTPSQPDEFPERLQGASLCDSLLVGGVTTGGQGFTPTQLVLNPLTSDIIATPLDNPEDLVTSAHSTVIGPLDGDCWSFGGVDTDVEALTRIMKVNRDGATGVAAGTELSVGRFGAAAALISQGPLAGTVMIAGGLVVTRDGDAYLTEPAAGVELFRP